MSLLWTNLYLFALATLLAILEIQIEGQHGWAKNLPTWRPGSGKWYVRLYEKLTSKEFTGYHLVMFSFVLLIFHLPYVFGLALTLDDWLRTMGLYFLFLVLWDFLWFVLNPHYPLKQFKSEHIWWHRNWLWLMPVDYYGGILLSLFAVVPLAFLQQTVEPLQWWLGHLVLFGIETAIVAWFTLEVLDIDHWGDNPSGQ